MYLKTCCLSNTGPVSQFDIEMPFDDGGNPKPVVLVGSNGTGKTVVLSYIADALVEIAKKGYQDVVPGQGHNSPYLRVVSGGSRKVGTSYSFALLRFEVQQDVAPQQLFYREQTGEIAPPEWDQISQQHFYRTFPWKDQAKDVEGASQTLVEEAFAGTSNCFFPSSRSERPHWYNSMLAQPINPFDLGENFNKYLGTRPIVVTEAAAQNQSWLLHVYLDSRADFTPYVTNTNQLGFHLQDQAIELVTRQAGLNNVAQVLREILRDPNVYLGLLPRTFGLSRICIAKGNEIVIPSLGHLSAGQAILFNTFLTIIRYADRADTNKSTSLQEIEGIVLIDEIDAHMHSDLQHDVLPKLMKLFPRIQFIVTSHAPLFVLGMEREFGPDGYLLLDMPNGNAISAERFSEFQRSFDYYQQTKAFEDEQREHLRVALEEYTKPLVLTEGDTDPNYLRTALELQGRTDLLSIIDIEWIGSTRNGQPFFTGDKNLNNASEFLRANPRFLENRRVLLLYDCDTNKPSLTENNLWVRSIPYNQTNIEIRKGIENLLPSPLFDPTDRRFYSHVEKRGDYNQVTIVSDFNKRAFCEHVCNERRNLADFTNFRAVIAILEQFANNTAAPSDTTSQATVAE